MTEAVYPSAIRRWLVPGLFTIIGLAILISLGFWQLERKQWKEGLIASLDQQMKAPPVPLPPAPQWSGLTRTNSEFRRVSLRVEFLPDAPAAYLYTGASALREDVRQPGYFVFAPARLPDGRIVVVNRGYVPIDRQHEKLAGPVDLVGFIRWPESSGLFVSDRDATGDIWFVRDPEAMAQVRDWGSVAPFYIDQESPVPFGGLPRPGTLTVKLRNDHLGYAITWFGLAASLAAVFAAWVARNRYHKTV